MKQKGEMAMTLFRFGLFFNEISDETLRKSSNMYLERKPWCSVLLCPIISPMQQYFLLGAFRISYKTYIKIRN